LYSEKEEIPHPRPLSIWRGECGKGKPSVLVAIPGALQKQEELAKNPNLSM